MTGCAAGFPSTREATMTGRQRTMFVAPPLLIVTMFAAFRQFTTTLGFPLGYLAAFCLYWTCWCVALPIALLGPRRVVALFTTGPAFTGLEITTQLLLWWPVAFPFMFAFLPHLADTDTRVIVASVALGALIGVTEELLWRGVYVTLFADNVWLNSVYPSVAFGVWHLCPLSVLPADIPAAPRHSPCTQSRSDSPTHTRFDARAQSGGAPFPIASTTRLDWVHRLTPAG